MDLLSKVLTVNLLFSTFIVESFCTNMNGNAQRADFIIAGGGTSGCALAGRLCVALPNAKISLLQGGKKRNLTEEFQVRSPRFAFDVINNNNITEKWSSLPNKGLLGNRAEIITGRTLRGSSSINGMQWTIPFTGTVELEH